MRRRDLSKVLLASAAGSALTAARVEAAPAIEGTRAEAEAGVRPDDARYPPGDVRRYGARGDGVNDDTAAFQRAIDVARRASSGSVYAPTGAAGNVIIPPPERFYLLGGPLDCTFDGRANQHGLAIRADSAPSPDSPAIIARHGGHVFDLTGCNSAVFENLNIGTDERVSPATCFFLARNSSAASAGYHRFRNVRVHGRFRAAVLYNYGSESNVCSECVWCNESTAAGTKVAVFTSHNILGLGSSFTATACGAQSCIDHQILGGNFLNTSADAAADVLYLDAVNSVKIFGPWMMAGGRASGRALIYVDSTNGPSSLCEIYALQGEAGSTQAYGCYFGGERDNIASGWTVDGCFVPNSRFALYCAPNATLDNFYVSNLREGVAHGISAHAVQNSTISCGALPLTIAVSRGNALIGDSSRWNIGRREHDCWMDSGAANKTWTPDAGALHVRGELRIENASCAFHGPLVTLSTTLSASSSLECPAGAALGGLPAPAIAVSALVSVSDARSGAALGCGSVRGAVILLPEISARQSVAISASYFVA